MKIKKSIFYIIALILFGINISGVCAATDCKRVDKRYPLKQNYIVHPTDDTYNGENVWVLQEQCSGDYVFCISKGAKAPHIDYGISESSCKFSNTVYNANSGKWITLSDSLRAALGYVIRSSHSYAEKQLVIHKLMYDSGVGKKPSTYNLDLFKAAMKVKKAYDATVTIELGDFTLVGTNYVASYTLTSSESLLSSIDVTTNVGTIDTSKKTVTVPVSSAGVGGEISVTLTASSSYTFKLSKTKSCGTSVQPIATVSTEDKTISYSDTSTKEITVDGDLIIYKENSSNDSLKNFSGTTTFMLYTGRNSLGECTGTQKTANVEAGGVAKFQDLTPGTYYLKESSAKKGYHTPKKGEDWYCQQITISSGDNEITISNKTECEFAFEAGEYKPENEEVSYSLNTMLGRIKLFNDIKLNYGLTFNALLNMENINAADACRNITVEKKYNKSCLVANSTSTDSSSFSDTNVSMYTENYGSYTFCLTRYNMINNLGIESFNNIKSGQPIIKSNDVVATGTLNRICYNFGDDNINDVRYNNFDYSYYVPTDASIDGVLLSKTETPSGSLNNKTITATYRLPIMYASNKDGRIHYGDCPNGEYCKDLGRGVKSNFNLRPGTYNLNFNIELNNSELGSLGTSNDCSYTVLNELIDYKNKLNIEFRLVNTNSSTAFLSKNGTNKRKIGSNWKSNDVQKEVLDNRNDSYNKKGTGPKYSITLIPSDINSIREYNKLTSYDDYTLYCDDDGSNCHSRFLESMKSGTLQYFDVQTEEVEKSWILKNKLIIKEDI